MSQKIVRRVVKIDDATLVKMIERLCKDVNLLAPNIQYTYVAGVSFSPSELNKKLLPGRYNISEANLKAKVDGFLDLIVSFNRQVFNHQYGVHTPSLRQDEFEIIFEGQPEQWSKYKDEAMSILEAIGGTAADTSQNEDVSTADTLRALMDGLSSTHRQMLASLDERIELADERRIQAENEAAEREEKRRDEHQKSLELVDAERAKLSLQSHMSERRRLLETLTESSQKQAYTSQLPRGAMAMRWGVFYASLTVTAVAGILSFQSFAALGGDRSHSAIDWIILSRALLAALSQLGLLFMPPVGSRLFMKQMLKPRVTFSSSITT